MRADGFLIVVMPYINLENALDATFVIIVGRRSNNLRDLIWRIPTEGIKIVSYDRLIEAAQIFVRDVV